MTQLHTQHIILCMNILYTIYVHTYIEVPMDKLLDHVLCHFYQQVVCLFVVE